MSTKRILKEFSNLREKGYVTRQISDDCLRWMIILYGPDSTPYYGGRFLLDIHFPNNYPFSPPKVHFVNRIYHPNIDLKGNICMAILKDEWVPSYTIDYILESITGLLLSPNISDPLRPELAKLFTEKLDVYNNEAFQVTFLHTITDIPAFEKLELVYMNNYLENVQKGNEKLFWEELRKN